MHFSGFRSFAAVGLLVASLLMGVSAGGRGAEIAPLKQSYQRLFFARRIFEISDVVLQQHIHPPTRQQMLLAGFKAEDASEPDSEFVHRVSEVQTPTDLAALFNERWGEEYTEHRTRVLEQNILTDVLQANQYKIAQSLASFQRDVWHQLTKRPEGELEEEFLEGLLRSVPGRPSLMSRKESRVESQLQANRYVGLGIALQRDEKLSMPRIVNVIPGGTAEAGGVLAGDVIEQVADVKIQRGAELQDVIDLIRGPEGTEVTLHLRGKDSKNWRKVKLARLPVVIKTVHEVPVDAAFQAGSTLKIGKLKIDSITASTAHELQSWEVKLRNAGVQALILDLRGAGGRSSIDTYHSAVLLADSLLDAKPVGKLRKRAGAATFTADRDCLFRDWPLAVLIDGHTFGPAEWVAAALQDADPPTRKIGRRAAILGRPSYGSNFVNTAITLPGDDESLILATGTWERPDLQRQNQEHPDRSRLPNSAVAQTWCVVPDIAVGEDPAELQGVERPARLPRKASPSKLPPRIAAGSQAAKKAAPEKPAKNLEAVVIKTAIAELQRQWKGTGKSAAKPGSEWR